MAQICLLLLMKEFNRHDYFKDHRKVGILTIISVFTPSNYDKRCIFDDFLTFLKKKTCFSIPQTGFRVQRVNDKSMTYVTFVKWLTLTPLKWVCLISHLLNIKPNYSSSGRTCLTLLTSLCLPPVALCVLMTLIVHRSRPRYLRVHPLMRIWVSHIDSSSIIYLWQSCWMSCRPFRRYLCSIWFVHVGLQAAQRFISWWSWMNRQRCTESPQRQSMIKVCQEAAAAAQRMNLLFVFGKAGILYVTPQVDRSRNKASALSTHFSVPSSSHFLLPHFLFPGSHPLFVQLSLSRFSFFSPSAVISCLFFSLSFYVCVCVCVCV